MLSIPMCKAEIDRVMRTRMSIGSKVCRNAPCIGAARHGPIMPDTVRMCARPLARRTGADCDLHERGLYSRMTAADVPACAW
ncbi:MAG: hypothetical protein GDA53_08225 [Rhodobacteraceae bacterium]|nr:hypothetical protein [Paracoccaceae bacterium]